MVSKIVVMYSIITFLIIIYNCLKSKIIEYNSILKIIMLRSSNSNTTRKLLYKFEVGFVHNRATHII